MQIIDLDIGTYQVPQAVYAKQGDMGRKFQIRLTDGQQEYIPAEGAWFSLWYSGTSGLGNYTCIEDRNAFLLEGSLLTVELIPNMLANKGGGTLCLLLHDEDGRQIGFWNIPYVCEVVPGLGSQEVTAHCSALTEYAKAAAESAAAAQAAVEQFQVDDSLLLSGMAADAAVTGQKLGVLQDDVHKLDMYKLDYNVFFRSIRVNADENTGTLWQQLRDYYAYQHVNSIRYICAEVEVPYDAPEELEPGTYRVTMTKGDSGKGFVEVEGTVEDAWGAPKLTASFFDNGIWTVATAPAEIHDARHYGRVLWENSDVNVEFTGMTVDLDSYSDRCNALLICFDFSTEYHGYSQTILVRRIETESTGGSVIFPTGSAMGIHMDENHTRYCIWNGRQLQFGDGYVGNTKNNTMAIPKQIYGIRI